MQRLKAAVVGAGMIGARMRASPVAGPLTHAAACIAAGFDLVALVDPATDLAALAAHWNTRGYSDFTTMMTAERPDIVILSTPVTARPDLLTKLLEYRVGLVIAEKPLTSDLSQAAAIVEAYRRAGIPLLVNYSRRYTQSWRHFAGRPAMSATIRYAKGLRHNGTHAIDLCRMLFGECLDVRALSSKHDAWDNDPTISAFLAFERCPEVFLQSLDERCFTQFEVDITGSDYRIIVDNDGYRLRRYELQENVGVPPGRRLIEVESVPTGAENALLVLMQNARAVLAGAAPYCSGEDAVRAQEIAARISHAL